MGTDEVIEDFVGASVEFEHDHAGQVVAEAAVAHGLAEVGEDAGPCAGDEEDAAHLLLGFCVADEGGGPSVGVEFHSPEDEATHGVRGHHEEVEHAS